MAKRYVMQFKIRVFALPMLMGMTLGMSPVIAADRPVFDIPTTTKPPKIDGDLTDDAWKGALRGGDYVRFNGSAPF
jgi:hypothetical protein